MAGTNRALRIKVLTTSRRDLVHVMEWLKHDFLLVTTVTLGETDAVPLKAFTEFTTYLGVRNDIRTTALGIFLSNLNCVEGADGHRER